jgi:hypothetical protein
VREKTLAAADVGELERVVYAPMPEHKRLGYISVASLIINKMIGTLPHPRQVTALTS